mmetsp:Transcript_10227/g.27833  ORF Transcript_10227/g.27833 Transcript_10227/m.27833 type:complete len:257 (-) Transcript_10227:17-787(-)
MSHRDAMSRSSPATVAKVGTKISPARVPAERMTARKQKGRMGSCTTSPQVIRSETVASFSFCCRVFSSGRMPATSGNTCGVRWGPRNIMMRPTAAVFHMLTQTRSSVDRALETRGTRRTAARRLPQHAKRKTSMPTVKEAQVGCPAWDTRSKATNTEPMPPPIMAMIMPRHTRIGRHTMSRNAASSAKETMRPQRSRSGGVLSAWGSKAEDALEWKDDLQGTTRRSDEAWLPRHALEAVPLALQGVCRGGARPPHG